MRPFHTYVGVGRKQGKPTTWSNKKVYAARIATLKFFNETNLLIIINVWLYPKVLD